MSRWQVLWGAIAKWWRNEPPPYPSLPDKEEVVGANRMLVEYRSMYAKRTKSPFQDYNEMAAQAVQSMEIERGPSLEGEVRVLAIAVTYLTEHLNTDIRRQHEVQRLEYTRRW